MDVHPTTNVSIGIDPYPYIYIYIYIMVLLGMKQHFWDHRMIEWWCLELAVYIYIYTPYYGKWWWTNWFPFYPTVQTTPRRSQKRPRRIGRWFGSRGSYIDGPGFQWRNLGQEKTTMMGKPGKTWETTCFIYVLLNFSHRSSSLKWFGREI